MSWRQESNYSPANHSIWQSRRRISHYHTQQPTPLLGIALSRPLCRPSPQSQQPSAGLTRQLQPRAPLATPAGSYRHNPLSNARPKLKVLTKEEKNNISRLKKNKKTVLEISRILGLHPSTIHYFLLGTKKRKKVIRLPNTTTSAIDMSANDAGASSCRRGAAASIQVRETQVEGRQQQLIDEELNQPWWERALSVAQEHGLSAGARCCPCAAAASVDVPGKQDEGRQQQLSDKVFNQPSRMTAAEAAQEPEPQQQPREQIMRELQEVKQLLDKAYKTISSVEST